MKLIKLILKNHLEWIVFTVGLIALALMDPTNSNPSLCLIERAGIPYCPGDGLGHSIAYTFRGDWTKAIHAHFMGPLAVAILCLRVLYIWINMFKRSINKDKE